MSIQIEIDFEVFKQLTVMRESETVSYNDVIRRLLGLEARTKPAPQSEACPGGWTTKGVTFPTGTEFRARYKGQTIKGRVEGGALVVNERRFDSPSAAARAVTHNSVNGWRFWECKLPGASSWQTIDLLRRVT